MTDKEWTSRDFLIDAGERIVFSFIFGVVSLVIIDLGDGKFDSPWRDLLAGGIMAGLSTLKAIMGALKKDTTTPASLL